MFIAEVSSNHHQNLDRCLEFVDCAARIGCSSVKFQLFRVNQLFSPEVFKAMPKTHDRAKWELPVSFLKPLAERSHELGIQFSATPFYLEAVSELAPFVDFFKVASYELLWNDLLTACARTGKPVILSTGMATLEEIRTAVRTLREASCQDITLLHCTSSYPTPPEQCNLAAIQTLREEFGCKVGWSDHSARPTVIQRAVHRWGAEAIEFHLDLDGEGSEYKTGHCWLPNEIEPVIRDVSIALQSDGDGIKAPVPNELAERDWRADPGDGLRPLQKIRASLKPVQA